MDLANDPIQEDKEYIATSTFDGPLKQMDTVETFKEQINLLSTEANVIKGGYDSIRQLRLSNDILDEITTNIIKIDSLFDGDKVNTMQNTVIAYGLAPDYRKPHSQDSRTRHSSANHYFRSTNGIPHREKQCH